MKIKIPNSDIAIGPDGPIFTIAEIGKGFIQTSEDKPVREYLENAKSLVKAAKESGATSVKFQTHQVDDEQMNIPIRTPHFSTMDRYAWVKKNTDVTPVMFWQELKAYCDELDIVFFSAPMSRGAARLLEEEVGVSLWKVGSADILDFVMLDYIASTGKPIIISAGMSNLEETDRAIEFLRKRTDQIVLMHCVSIYPCPPEKLNLGTIPFFKERYGLPVGFSSHSLEWQSSVAAVNLGAVALEKHFTFDRRLWGSDHKVSLLPHEFKAMVESIKRGEVVDAKYYGVENKVLHEDEAVFRPLFRKTLVALADIPTGTAITPEHIGAMRPQAYLSGLPSEKYEEVVGRRLKRALKKYEPIKEELLD